MEIRKTTGDDLGALQAIYDKARAFMRRTGNMHQWSEDYPSVETAREDMRRSGSYVCVQDGRVVATFFFTLDGEPTYVSIQGAWLNDAPYGVIHRVASDGTVPGVMHKILDFCFGMARDIRIDTHRDNLVMQQSLTRYGFAYCGIIHLANGDERLAYQMTRPANFGR